MIYFYIEILSGILLGLLSYGITIMLDFAMDRGNLLDFVRIKIATWLNLGLKLQFNEAELSGNWELRKDAYDAIYWNLAYEKKSFKALICNSCMGQWINLFTVLATILIVPYSIVSFVLTLIFSSIVNYIANAKF